MSQFIFTMLLANLDENGDIDGKSLLKAESFKKLIDYLCMRRRINEVVSLLSREDRYDDLELLLERREKTRSFCIFRNYLSNKGITLQFYKHHKPEEKKVIFKSKWQEGFDLKPVDSDHIMC